MDNQSQDDVYSKVSEGRSEFLALVADIRPELHRYCARMTGSVVDGEDIVQETLARAYFELPELKELPAMRPWLFRIAHNRAIDFLRRYERRMGEPLDETHDVVDTAGADPEAAAARDEAVRAAVARFLDLAPAQRSCVILKDVLDYSLDEIAGVLDLSVAAVKSALHRGRTRLRELSDAPEAKAVSVSPALERYAALFNARDWDGVRAMIADDVRLDLVSRLKRTGADVSIYFTNYARYTDWYVVPGRLDGREVIAVYGDERAVRPTDIIELTIVDGRVALIRDYRYVPYIMRDAVVDVAREEKFE